MFFPRKLVASIVVVAALIGCQPKNSPLHMALIMRENDKAMQLIADGADPNSLDRWNKTPLVRAAELGDSSLVLALLEAGAHVNPVSPIPVTRPLTAAAARGDTVLMKLLLERGADVNAEDEAGVTAIVKAARSCTPSAVKMLFEHGVDVNAPLKYGSSALIRSAGLSLGANLHSRGAAQGRNEAAIDTAAVLDDCEAAVRLVLDAGAEINAHDWYGKTALMSAGGGGCEGIVQMLLRRGANVNATGSRGGTALLSAASSGHASVVKLLLDAGADPEARTAQGNSSQTLARGRGHKEVVELLENPGADG